MWGGAGGNTPGRYSGSMVLSQHPSPVLPPSPLPPGKVEGALGDRFASPSAVCPHCNSQQRQKIRAVLKGFSQTPGQLRQLVSIGRPAGRADTSATTFYMVDGTVEGWDGDQLLFNVFLFFCRMGVLQRRSVSIMYSSVFISVR